MKEYNRWNKLKKILEYNSRIYFKEREIRWCCLGLNIGHEQDGTTQSFERPVLILKRFNKSVCIVLPLSTTIKDNKYYFDIGSISGVNASVIISQLRLIDSKRLSNKLCTVDSCTFDDIRKTVRNLF